ncbi:MAG: cytochrome b N-terminal domain-containing protein [Myxococcota bacterium]|nr:cytochrome b N-terminal domain-containing protein [Myxococcota bacterium]
MRWLRRIGSWIYDRAGLEAGHSFLLQHKVPAVVTGRKGWMYVFGTSLLAMFLLQALTGIALATLYVPSADHAYESIRFITVDVLLGGLLRALHFFGASAMIVLLMIHAARTFLTAAYKFPREMNWISGVVLGLLVFGMAFTGQTLRWDDSALWGVVVAGHFADRVPWIGPWLSDLIIGGETVDGVTLTRFYATHVFLLPITIVALIGLHMFLVVHHGISEPPKAGEKVDPATYREKYAALKKSGRKYFPYMALREAITAAVIFAIVLVLALVVGPQPLTDRPDPTLLSAEPHPDWFVVWYYGLLFFKDRGLEALFMVYAPILLVIGAIALPLLFPKGERSPTRRPWAVVLVVFAFLVFGALILIGQRAPWAPAIGTEPLGPEQLGPVSPEVQDGALTFHEQGCQYCHSVAGVGGDYGPDLTDVAARLSPGDIAVRTIYGYGDMPAYRDRISREQLDRIVLFLRAVREEQQP